MQVKNIYDKESKTHIQKDDKDIQRLTAQFDVSPDDAEERIAIIERQKKMTQALIIEKKSMEN